MVERILHLMDKKEINAAKLTSDLGLPVSAVTDWKKGKYKPSTDAIIKIAAYFGVTTDYLLTGADGISSSIQSQPQSPKTEDFLAEQGITDEKHVAALKEILALMAKNEQNVEFASEFDANGYNGKQNA